MKTINPLPEAKNTDSALKPIYRLGAWSAMIAALIFRRNLDAEFLLFRMIVIINGGPMTPPSTILDWFMLLHSDPLIGLTILKVFDIVNYILVGLIFLDLCAALKQVNKSLVTLAAAFGILGIATYLASNQALTMLSLSNQFAAASTDVQRTMLLSILATRIPLHNLILTNATSKTSRYKILQPCTPRVTSLDSSIHPKLHDPLTFYHPLFPISPPSNSDNFPLSTPHPPK